MPRKKPEKTPGAKPQPQPVAGLTGRPWWDSKTWPGTANHATRIKNLDRYVKNMVEDFGAEPWSISLVPVPVTDDRRIVVELKFQIRGVDYCFGLPIVLAAGIDDDLRVRQAKVTMAKKLRSDMELAFHGWGMMELMEPYRVKPVVPVPPPPPPVSTKFRRKVKPKPPQGE